MDVTAYKAARLRKIESEVFRIIDEMVTRDHGVLITSETKLLEDLGFDSLDCVETAMELEEVFLLDIADEDVIQAQNYTVGDVIAYIDRRLAAVDC